MGKDLNTVAGHLYPDDEDIAIGRHEIAGGHAVVYSCRGPGKATPNEDAAAVIPIDRQAGVLAVADGVGGLRAGREAANIAVSCLARTLSDPAPVDELLRTRILNAMERANDEVIDLGVGAGTTLAIAEINNGVVRAYHVGDAAVMLVGQKGRIKFLTIPHTPIGLAQEAGFLDEHEAIRHEDRHLLSNMVGSSDMRIEVGPPVTMAAYDTVLVASDGLFDNLNLDEIVEIVRKGPLEEVREQLSAGALIRMTGALQDHPSKPDDLTFVGFRPDSDQ